MIVNVISIICRLKILNIILIIMLKNRLKILDIVLIIMSKISYKMITLTWCKSFKQNIIKTNYNINLKIRRTNYGKITLARWSCIIYK